ncbi:hypothetical protein HETIRDRAFT_435222 [Heterobasidion irregulare TC 32-1]|uniref:Uncharacterized protein n=1 Tax=Heterobasidion irregulare (strain TC 32-1) TaxID=747525 RepID=W4K4Q3_HETIT|nr:uncharacterized protein HETIRDRAFT_435222 [Heterobasidion irregulare TC 32-1]ETW80041.1 hypothetical protein HETIRDRAFT_435222 [Heterobasidion irregulare TC 32-1]
MPARASDDPVRTIHQAANKEPARSRLAAALSVSVSATTAEPHTACPFRTIYKADSPPAPLRTRTCPSPTTGHCSVVLGCHRPPHHARPSYRSIDDRTTTDLRTPAADPRQCTAIRFCARMCTHVRCICKQVAPSTVPASDEREDRLHPSQIVPTYLHTYTAPAAHRTPEPTRARRRPATARHRHTPTDADRHHTGPPDRDRPHPAVPSRPHTAYRTLHIGLYRRPPHIATHHT